MPGMNCLKSDRRETSFWLVCDGKGHNRVAILDGLRLGKAEKQQLAGAATYGNI